MQRIWQALGWLTAVALASLVPAFAFWLGTGEPALKNWVSFAKLSLMTAVVFVLPLVVIVGSPLALLCRRFGWTGPIAAAVVAFLAGVAGFLAWGPLFNDGPSSFYRLSADMIESVIRSGICGALGGLAFWATLRFWPKAESKA